MSVCSTAICETNGIYIHYTRTGRNSLPLILLHGLTANGICWTALARYLEGEYDVIMPDARGHGKSSVPDDGYRYEDHAKDIVGLIKALRLHWRLYDTGYLGRLNRISSVSGGSVTAAVLGLSWIKLLLSASPDWGRFEEYVVNTVRNLAGETIDASAIIGGILLPGTISEKVQAAYARLMFGKATLQDLPDEPRFVINATNVQSGALWRFSKPYMRDYRVGEVVRPAISLAMAVAAPSAYPPVLSPLALFSHIVIGRY